MTPPPKGNNSTFVVTKVTNKMIYDEVLCIKKAVGTHMWHIRIQWICIGLLGTGVVLILNHLI